MSGLSKFRFGMNKKNIVVALIVGVFAVALGVGSVRLGMTQNVFKERTITYRLTFYDQGEKEVVSNILVRRVRSDGTWSHTQVSQDGKVVKTNGKLKSALSGRGVDNNSPEHLRYRYVVEKNNDTETWISPELQDYLKFTSYRSDGTRESVMEAVDVALP